MIDFVGGFQPSLYDPRVHNGVIAVPTNVVKAHCIYDPNFVDTGGLGAARYVLPPGSKTILTVTQHPGAHPDDWGVSQDMMFNDVVACLKGRKDARIAVMYGQGGAAIEYWETGERQLVKRLHEIGVDTGGSVYNWDDRQAIYNWLHGYTGFRGLIGDSLGAGSAVEYAGDLK